MTTHSSGRRFGVRSVYTLAGEWGTGSHPLVLPNIDVSRQSTGLGKIMRLKASNSLPIAFMPTQVLSFPMDGGTGHTSFIGQGRRSKREWRMGVNDPVTTLFNSWFFFRLSPLEI